MEAEKIKNLPFFFIIGRPRSGTTLLELFFDAHPNVQIPSECMYIGQLWLKYSLIRNWDSGIIEQFLKDLGNTWLFTYDKFNIPVIRKELNEICNELDYSTVCKIVSKNYNTVFKKDELMIIGDKNPFYSQIFGSIFPIIKNSKFIHLIRDPRDTHISLFNAQFITPSITYNTRIWKKSVRTIEAYQKYYPDRFYFIKYEDFVTNPEKYLREMCTFLNIPFAPEMMNYLERKKDLTKVVFVTENYINLYHQSVLQPVSTSKTGQWRTRLKKSKIRKAERVAGEFLDKYGYERLTKYPGWWTYISTFPGLFLYYAIEYFQKFTVKLPLRWQLKIALKIHIPFQIWWRTFYKNKKL